MAFQTFFNYFQLAILLGIVILAILIVREALKTPKVQKYSKQFKLFGRNNSRTTTTSSGTSTNNNYTINN